MNWHFWRPRPDTDGCDSLDPLLSPYADGMASPEEARRVESHLPDCPACRDALLWMRATRRALASRPVLLPPADLRARIAQGIAASGRRAAPVRIPSARRALALRPALAGAFGLAVLGVVGYTLMESHPSAKGTSGPSVQVATGPAVTAPPLISPHVTPQPVQKRTHSAPRPVHDPALIANAETPDANDAPPASPDVQDETKPVAVITHASAVPLPAKAQGRLVVPVKTPRPRVVPSKKPVRPRANPDLIATGGAPKPSSVNVPAPKKPDANSQVALMPKEPTVPHTPAPDTVTPQPSPAPEVVATAEPRVRTASLLGPVQDYLRVHRSGVEHFSRSEYTAVRSTTHTAVYTSGLDSSPVTVAGIWTPTGASAPVPAPEAVPTAHRVSKAVPGNHSGV